MKFKWDYHKNETNIKKHGITFEDAQTVFDDIFAVIVEDRLHSSFEYREIIIGQSIENHLLYVVFVEKDDHLRIISARRLTPAERKRYEQRQYNQELS